MSGILTAGSMADPSASWLKFVTIGNEGVDEYGFRAGSFGSVQYTNRMGGKVVTQFAYEWDVERFVFEIDETNPGGFNFTQLQVENSFGGFLTLLKSSAIEYAGFPLKGWIWSSTGTLWTLANVGTVKKIFVQR